MPIQVIDFNPYSLLDSVIRLQESEQQIAESKAREAGIRADTALKGEDLKTRGESNRLANDLLAAQIGQAQANARAINVEADLAPELANSLMNLRAQEARLNAANATTAETDVANRVLWATLQRERAYVDREQARIGEMSETERTKFLAYKAEFENREAMAKANFSVPQTDSQTLATMAALFQLIPEAFLDKNFRSSFFEHASASPLFRSLAGMDQETYETMVSAMRSSGNPVQALDQGVTIKYINNPGDPEAQANYIEMNMQMIRARTTTEDIFRYMAINKLQNYDVASQMYFTERRKELQAEADRFAAARGLTPKPTSAPTTRPLSRIVGGPSVQQDTVENPVPMKLDGIDKLQGMQKFMARNIADAPPEVQELLWRRSVDLSIRETGAMVAWMSGRVNKNAGPPQREVVLPLRETVGAAPFVNTRITPLTRAQELDNAVAVAVNASVRQLFEQNKNREDITVAQDIMFQSLLHDVIKVESPKDLDALLRQFIEVTNYPLTELQQDEIKKIGNAVRGWKPPAASTPATTRPTTRPASAPEPEFSKLRDQSPGRGGR